MSRRRCLCWRMHCGSAGIPVSVVEQRQFGNVTVLRLQVISSSTGTEGRDRPPSARHGSAGPARAPWPAPDGCRCESVPWRRQDCSTGRVAPKAGALRGQADAIPPSGLGSGLCAAGGATGAPGRSIPRRPRPLLRCRTQHPRRLNRPATSHRHVAPGIAALRSECVVITDAQSARPRSARGAVPPTIRFPAGATGKRTRGRRQGKSSARSAILDSCEAGRIRHPLIPSQ